MLTFPHFTPWHQMGWLVLFPGSSENHVYPFDDWVTPQMFSCIPMDDSVSTPQMFSCIPIGRLWVNTTNILVYLFYYPGSALQTLLCMPIEWSWVNTTDILVYTHWMTLGQHNHVLGRIKESCHSLQCELGHCLQNLIDMSLFLASISVPAMVFL